jgi:dihydropteroate synthase
MGILNTTPDSFYDRGRYRDLHRAVDRALEMIDEGADIIDIGGERAGPGEPVTLEEELSWVVPVVEALRRQTALPISVDTLKPRVALAAISAGADMINSISGFDDPAMRRVAQQTAAAIVVMHIQGQPRFANPHPHYRDVVGEVRQFLLDRTLECLEDGISPERILVDPGPGFGKTTQHDIAVLRGLSSFTALPYPVVLAASRKKFIGEILGTDPEDRLEGSLAVVAWGVMQGVRVVRVHDVRASRQVCEMTEAVLNPTAVEAKG